MTKLLILFCCLLSLGQLQRIELANDVAFYLHDIFIVLWLLHALIFKNFWKKLSTFLKEKISLKKSQQISKLTLFFLLWSTIGLVINFILNGLQIKPFLYILRIALYIFFGVNLHLNKNNLKLRIQNSTFSFIRLAFIYFGLATLYFGFLQYILLPDTRFLKIAGWDDHYYRLISTQFDPNFTGIILVLTFLYWQSLTIFKNIKSKQSKFLKYSTDLLIICGLLLTYSRASYLAFIVAVMLLVGKFLKQKKQGKEGELRPWVQIKKYLIYLILFLSLIPFLPRPTGEGVKLERTTSINARFSTNERILKSLKPYQWIIGQGVFTKQIQKESPDSLNARLNIPDHAYLADNLIVMLIAYTGLIGTGIFFLILWKWSRELIKKDFYIFTSLIAILAHSMFNNTLLQAFVLLMLIGGIVSINKE